MIMTIRKNALLLVAVVGVTAAVGLLATNSIRAQNSGIEASQHRQHHERRKGMDKIKHVVFIVKENRTFDNYFGTFPGANGATYGTLSTGVVVPLGQAPDVLPRDISHSYQSAVLAIDGGAMDRFDLIPGANKNGDLLAYTQYTEADIPNYFAYAQTFVLAD